MAKIDPLLAAFKLEMRSVERLQLDCAGADSNYSLPAMAVLSLDILTSSSNEEAT